MSLTVLIIGVFLQLAFAAFQFMAVIFAAGAAVNSGDIKPWQMTILDLSIILLPSVSVLISIVLIFLYQSKSRYLSNWWHAVPVAILILYLTFVFSLNGK